MPSPATRRGRGAVSRGVLVMWAFALICVSIPALFWWGTWYGRRLPDAKLEAYLSEDARPDHTRHGIEEITRRFDAGATGMDRWAAKLVEVSRRPDPVMRMTAAWAMGYDAGRPEFVDRLRELVADPEPLVRHNAAGALAKAGDRACLPVLRDMLEDFVVASPAAGAVEDVLGRDQPVKAGMTLAQVAAPDGTSTAVSAPRGGTVAEVLAPDGTEVTAGEAVVRVRPDADTVLNAALGLMLMGEEADRPLLGRVADPRSGYAEAVRKQARAALSAIESRTAK